MIHGHSTHISSARPERLLTALILLIVPAVAAGLLFSTDFLYLQYDAYYYAAVAEGLVRDGSMLDHTVTPAAAVITPQNGIVFVMALLEIIGVDDLHSRLIIILVLNALCIAGSALVVIRLARLLGLPSTSAQLLGVSLAVSFYLYAVLLQMINDASALFMSLTAILLIIDRDIRHRYQWLLAIALLLPLFRLSGVLLFACASLAWLLSGDMQRFIKYAALGLVSVSLPVLSMALFANDGAVVGNQLQSSLSFMGLHELVQRLLTTFTLSIPEAFFRMSWFTMNLTVTKPWIGAVITAPLVLALCWLSLRAWKKRNTPVVFLCLNIWSLLVYFHLFHAQPTRYIILAGLLWSLLLVTLFTTERIRTTAAACFLAIIIIISVTGAVRSPLPGDGAGKLAFSANMEQLLAQKPMPVYSYFPRVSWFHTGQASHSDLVSACQYSQDGDILLIAPEVQAKQYIANYQAETGKQEIYITSLKPMYQGYIASPNPKHYFKYDATTVRSYLLHC